MTISADISTGKKMISIVIPVYDEEDNLEELARRLKNVFTQCPNYDFEVLMVENGSHDRSWEIIQTLNRDDPRFKSIQLSRNFMAMGGITAGLKFARGDAAFVINADLQDPPERIPEFIAKWEEGYDVVYHVVSERAGVSFFRRKASEMFHWIMSKLSHGKFPKNGSVFRIMDRNAYQAFNQLGETNRYFPGMVHWIGFKSIGIEYPRVQRFAGRPKSPLPVVIRLALDGIFSYSSAPLRLATFFGVLISAVSLIYLLVIITKILLEGSHTVPGIATQISLTLFLFGILFLCIGLLGEYLSRVYDEVKGRPNFVVKKTLGLGAGSENEKLVRGIYRDGRIELIDPTDLSGEAFVVVKLVPQVC